VPGQLGHGLGPCGFRGPGLSKVKLICRRICQIDATYLIMSGFKAKMHQIRFLLGLCCSRPRLTVLPDFEAVFKGPASKWRRVGEGKVKGREGERS